MEEEKSCKEINMNVGKKQEAKKQGTVDMKPKKLTYEQLNDACSQLYQQNQNLLKKLQEANTYSMFKRLDYLFEVLRNKDSFNKKFVEGCAKEIEEAISIEGPSQDRKE
ncbi:MAG: hypothetical protein LKE41_02150 [Prevotella sp.]|nr:hypothetical protein [Prevotella sp.]MCI2103080.1 hypothetical protein [Prevotella sp.]